MQDELELIFRILNTAILVSLVCATGYGLSNSKDNKTRKRRLFIGGALSSSALWVLILDALPASRLYGSNLGDSPLVVTLAVVLPVFVFAPFGFFILHKHSRLGWIKSGNADLETCMAALDDPGYSLKNSSPWLPKDAFLREALVKKRDMAVEPLINRLKETTNTDVIPILIRIGSPHTVEMLIATLSHEVPRVRVQAAFVLSRIADVRAIEPLITALKDSSESVRESVAEALRKIADARAIEPFIAALKDSSLKVRECAAEALGEIGDARAVGALVAALKDSDKDVRYSAAEALGKIGDEHAIKPLIDAYTEHDEVAFVKALTSIGTPEAKQEAQSLREMKQPKAGRIVVSANATAVETMCRVVDINLAEAATMLVARQYGRSEHLNASGGLSDSGYQAISGLYIWNTIDGGLAVTRGQDSPEQGASIVGPMSRLHECYVDGLINKFRG